MVEMEEGFTDEIASFGSNDSDTPVEFGFQSLASVEELQKRINALPTVEEFKNLADGTTVDGSTLNQAQTDVYAEILARICKETSTSFFVTSVIPLIPGSTLYYCMNSIVEGNTVRALEYGRDTFLFAFGIAAGMSIAWSICYFLRSVRKKQN